MAWPLTPLLTFVNGSSPACDAVFLNNLQLGVNGLCAGTYSYAGVVLDGTGGAVVTPTAGAVKFSAAVSATSTPTPAFAKGVGYKENQAFAAGAVRYTSPTTYTLDWGFNISSLSRASAGVININLVTAMASITNGVVMATMNDTPGNAGGVSVSYALMGGAGATAQVTMTGDASFYFVCYGA